MYQNGMSTANIAQQMGCSVQTVRNVTKDLREPKMVRMWSEVDKSKGTRNVVRRLQFFADWKGA